MPAGQSITGIMNIALIALGEDPIAAPTDGTKAAILCSARYTDVRQACIRKYGFNCAKKYAQLALSPTPPPFGWANAYDLPADYLDFYGIMDTDGATLDMSQWEIVGRQLLTDEGAPLDIMYFCDLGDCTVMDALMAQVIGYDLALEIGPELCRDDQRLSRIAKIRDEKLAVARSRSAQENSPREWDVDVLLRSRR